MRISDWSSDVCSSDLKILLKTSFLAMILYRPSAWEHLCARARRSHMPFQSHDCGFSKWHVRRKSDHLELPFHCAVRSEEHTSELQSLMRNSYAVFCLKKKTRYNIILSLILNTRFHA